MRSWNPLTTIPAGKCVVISFTSFTTAALNDRGFIGNTGGSLTKRCDVSTASTVKKVGSLVGDALGGEPGYVYK